MPGFTKLKDSTESTVPKYDNGTLLYNTTTLGPYSLKSYKSKRYPKIFKEDDVWYVKIHNDTKWELGGDTSNVDMLTSGEYIYISFDAKTRPDALPPNQSSEETQ